MQRCQPIAMLELDDESLQGIKRIGLLKESANTSVAILSGGKITLLFYKQRLPESALNIYNTDWELFYTAVQALPRIFRARMIQEAQLQQLSHQNDYKQKQFWESVAAGCSEITK